MAPGCVYLVGAGPGNPDLLTVRAWTLLQNANVLVYDRLVSKRILDLVRSGVSRIYVGKSPGRHILPQREINATLTRLALAGHDVVRLKGGDPFIFGRGGEEALHLARAGIPFEVVPGVTAATACAAYAGIPLTHRGYSSGMQLVTGHCRDDQPLDLDWRALADPSRTLVVYMGLSHLAEIRRGLLAAGREPATAAAVISRGTLDDQCRLLTTLDGLPAAAHARGITSPALLIVGEVVNLARELSWFTPLDPVADQIPRDTAVAAGHG